MTILKKTLVATTASFVALSGPAFAAAHAFDAGAARLDLANDQNGDGEVSDDELIRNNAFFDINGDGVIDATEREVAEDALEQTSGSMLERAMLEEMMAEMMGGAMIEFDAGAAQLDETLDTDGNGEITTDEIIDGNMAIFDTNGDGAIDAGERTRAEEAIESSATGSVDAMTTVGEGRNPALANFDVNRARLDQTNDQNGDGEVTDEEIIRMNRNLFDTNGNGAIDADEREIAEEILEQG